MVSFKTQSSYIELFKLYLFTPLTFYIYIYIYIYINNNNVYENNNQPDNC